MHVRNLPAITPRYWAAILVASMCGANTGDFLSHNLHLGHWRGLAPLAALFLLIVWAERRSRIATEAYYWLAIIVVRTAATNLADLATHDFGLGYPATDAALTALLAAVVALDPGRKQSANAVGRVVSSASIMKLPATDTPYWVAMLIAGTLGTASGDWVAHSLGLGFASVVLVAVFGVVLLTAWRVGGMSVSWYWTGIVAARTAGTTLGDYLASRHGLDLGLSVRTSLTACMLAAVVVLWPHQPAVVSAPAR
jgi:uncharacterized membrane-anchored protein